MWTHKTAILMILAAFVLFLATPGLARADEGNGGMEMTVNGYHVRLVFASPAKTGENLFHVQITGADGSPVSDVAVEVAVHPVEKTDAHEADMPAHDPATPAKDDGMAGMNMGGVDPTATPADSMAGMSGMAAATPTAASMTGMNMDEPAAQAVSVALQAGHEAGEYAGAVSFPQAGHWMLAVHFTLTNGEMLETEFPLDVVSGAPANYGVLAGFFGLNAVIIFAAAVTKRKAVRA